jgi:hypothetical protein
MAVSVQDCSSLAAPLLQGAARIVLLVHHRDVQHELQLTAQCSLTTNRIYEHAHVCNHWNTALLICGIIYYTLKKRPVRGLSTLCAALSLSSGVSVKVKALPAAFSGPSSQAAMLHSDTCSPLPPLLSSTAKSMRAMNRCWWCWAFTPGAT